MTSLVLENNDPENEYYVQFFPNQSRILAGRTKQSAVYYRDRNHCLNAIRPKVERSVKWAKDVSHLVEKVSKPYME